MILLLSKTVPIYLNSEYLVQIKNAYRICTSLGMVFSAVGIAFCGIRMLLGGTENARRMLQTMLMIFFAMSALLLIPSVVSSGVNLFSQLSWDPSHLR